MAKGVNRNMLLFQRQSKSSFMVLLYQFGMLRVKIFLYSAASAMVLIFLMHDLGMNQNIRRGELDKRFLQDFLSQGGWKLKKTPNHQCSSYKKTRANILR